MERSNKIMEFSLNTARYKGQKVKVKLVFPRNMSSCMSLFGIVLNAVHVMFTCYARAVRQNRFKPVQTGSNRIKPVQTGSNRIKPVQNGSNRIKPGKTQEKSAPSAVAAGYINRAATAIAITTVLRSLQSTSTQHYRALRDAATVASIYYILSMFVRN